MNEAMPRHPGAQTMAACLEGRLQPDEIASVASHLRDCDDCREVLAAGAGFERAEARAAAHVVRARETRMWSLAAAAAVVLLAIPLLFWWNESRRASIGHLIAAAPREHRRIEARLSGFPWAPVQQVRGAEAKDPADLQLDGAAGDVLKSGKTSKHAAGVADLLIGRTSDSITALEAAAKESQQDPRVWNDLAAARLAASADAPSQLPMALVAVTHALRLDPTSAEARFNHALVLERMGVTDQARTAWQAYLAIDGGSEWAGEARAHLQKLQPVSRRFDEKLLDTAPPDQLVREFPEETRRWSEGPLLARWAKAESAHDTAGAAAILARARVVADALATFNGEHLLDDAVAAIERSHGASRAALVEAYGLYAAARQDHARHNEAAAERGLRESAARFAAGGSAMAAAASYYAAGAAVNQGRGAAVHDELLRLLRSAGEHRALAADVHQTLAVEANRFGDWGAGVREADAASAIFSTLGERANAAFADSIAAYALELIGASDAAWSRWVRAMNGLCRGSDRIRCNALLNDAATTLAMVQRTPAAAAMIELTIDSRHGGDPVTVALAFAKRARALASSDADAARRALADARVTVPRIADRTVREDTSAQISIEEAAAESTSNPRAAIEALDRAERFFASEHADYILPHLDLQRARAHRAAGDLDAAARDYASALRATSIQETRIDDPALRFSFRDTATEAIEESIDLELSRGMVEAAFAIADRRHAFMPNAAPAPPAPGTAIIEYASLPHSLAIFCRAGDSVAAERVAVDRSALVERIDRFGSDVRRRAPRREIARDSTILYDTLIAPLESRLIGVQELVIIPDRQLYALPFAALYDKRRDRFLIEDFVIRVAPAAAAPVRESGQSFVPALVLADPRAAGQRPLPASREEGARIASLHGAALLSGSEATADRFLTAASRSALIHYAGHANSDATTSYGALLLADRVVGANEIARLSLAGRPLVVLAACGTFRGDAAHVAGMSSLARAFLMAGARGVIATLWEIDDDVSAPLFLRFHESLRAGASPARALREAQLAMLHSAAARLQDPATWAPVVDVETI